MVAHIFTLKKMLVKLLLLLLLLTYVSFWKLIPNSVEDFPDSRHLPNAPTPPRAEYDGSHLLRQRKSNTTKKQAEKRSQQSKPNYSSFAACLLIKDDNHFLIEWLAYHYHVLPLRNLIVAVDPQSKTSPATILDRWNDSDLNITVWLDDHEYITNTSEMAEAMSWVAIKFKQDNPSLQLVRHRARQRLFYYHCMLEHRRFHRTYTLLTDTDEFLTVNYDTLRQRKTSTVVSHIPTITQSGSVLQLLQHETKYYPGLKNTLTGSPCIQIPRARFGTVVDPSLAIPHPNRSPVWTSSTSWNASHMATLQWRYHAGQDNYGQNRISKTIIDVSRLANEDLQPVDSIHRPVRRYCGQRKLHIRSSDHLLLIHHYLGTWEQYSFRQDARQGNERSRTMYQKTAALKEHFSDMVIPWLSGFVDSVGSERAHNFLRNVGVVESSL